MFESETQENIPPANSPDTVLDLLDESPTIPPNGFPVSPCEQSGFGGIAGTASTPMGSDFIPPAECTSLQCNLPGSESTKVIATTRFADMTDIIYTALIKEALDQSNPKRRFTVDRPYCFSFCGYAVLDSCNDGTIRFINDCHVTRMITHKPTVRDCLVWMDQWYRMATKAEIDVRKPHGLYSAGIVFVPETSTQAKTIMIQVLFESEGFFLDKVN